MIGLSSSPDRPAVEDTSKRLFCSFAKVTIPLYCDSPISGARSMSNFSRASQPECGAGYFADVPLGTPPKRFVTPPVDSRPAGDHRLAEIGSIHVRPDPDPTPSTADQLKIVIPGSPPARSPSTGVGSYRSGWLAGALSDSTGGQNRPLADRNRWRVEWVGRYHDRLYGRLMAPTGRRSQSTFAQPSRARWLAIDAG